MVRAEASISFEQLNLCTPSTFIEYLSDLNVNIFANSPACDPILNPRITCVVGNQGLYTLASPAQTGWSFQVQAFNFPGQPSAVQQFGIVYDQLTRNVFWFTNWWDNTFVNPTVNCFNQFFQFPQFGVPPGWGWSITLYTDPVRSNSPNKFRIIMFDQLGRTQNDTTIDLTGASGPVPGCSMGYNPIYDSAIASIEANLVGMDNGQSVYLNSGNFGTIQYDLNIPAAIGAPTEFPCMEAQVQTTEISSVLYGQPCFNDAASLLQYWQSTSMLQAVQGPNLKRLPPVKRT